MMMRIVCALAFAAVLVPSTCGQYVYSEDGWAFIGGYSRYKLKATVYQYLGIPYAKPPVGELRFKKPEPPEIPAQPPQRSDYKPACPQYLDPPYPWVDGEEPQSEDCLYLNVFPPMAAVVTNQSWMIYPIVEGMERNVKRAVKVYVHGGGLFEGGSTRMMVYDGFGEASDNQLWGPVPAKKNQDQKYWSYQDGHVVVTMNYRLGALGFFSSGTEDAPGNVAIYDIAMALNWVFKYIHLFGGDPEQVTLVGQDGGAIAVSLLMTSSIQFPHKFKVVLNSNSFLSLLAMPGVDCKGDAYRNNLRLADELAAAVGCDGSVKDDPAGVVTCLRGKDVTEIVMATGAMYQQGLSNFFLPQIDGPHGLFDYNPYEYLAKNPNISRQDVLVSFTSDEGSHLLPRNYPGVFGTFGENDVPLSGPCAKKAARNILKKFPAVVTTQLLGNLDRNASVCNRKKVVKVIGDAIFVCPLIFYLETIKNFQKTENSQNKTYMLEKQTNPPFNPWGEWMGSVHFNNIQGDFLHPYGYFIREFGDNRTTYRYTEEQTNQFTAYNEFFKTFMYSNISTVDPFTIEKPAYAVMDLNGTISSDGNQGFHAKNCDILRPYFKFKE